MRVLMLGWEFPPFISGGLGTACYGLTRALSAQDVHITFVLPKSIGAEHRAPHVQLLSPQAQPPAPAAPTPDDPPAPRAPQDVASTYRYEPQHPRDAAAFEHVTFKAVPALFSNPYGRVDVGADPSQVKAGAPARPDPFQPVSVLASPPRAGAPVAASGAEYHGDLIQESRRYAELVLDLSRGLEFDVVHAHDWLTYPAGMAVAAHTGRPLIAHAHSTEFDRSGQNIDERIYDVERRGFHAAARVIAVSHLTRKILEHRYAVPTQKIDVVYNGINGGLAPTPPPARAGGNGNPGIRPSDQVVLFLGRITMQKGPEYFVAAAKRVLEKLDKVKFVMAGTGDRVKDVIELAAREGIGHKVLFTGFLRGEDVDKVFAMADVYVMPSVSEPFGIAALEAINNEVPVIMSKTAGVGEVVRHALKVDFWDTDEMANKIIAVLKHPPLAQTLRTQADLEVRKLTWDDAAEKTRGVYAEAMRFTG